MDAKAFDMDRFENLGVIKNKSDLDEEKLNNFEKTIKNYKNCLACTKDDIVREFLQ